MKLKLPSDWSEITLGQFVQILDIPVSDNKINDFVYKLSILSGVDSEVIKNTSTAGDLTKHIKKLSFMSRMPKAKNKNWFFWKYRFYKRHSLNETTSMQVADIMQASASETNEGAKILTVMSIVYFKGKDLKYNSDRYNKMKSEFEDLPFDIAYSCTLFFLNGLTGYYPNVLRRFSKKVEKMTLNQRAELHARMQKLSDANGLKEFINGMTLS